MKMQDWKKLKIRVAADIGTWKWCEKQNMQEKNKYKNTIKISELINSS